MANKIAIYGRVEETIKKFNELPDAKLEKFALETYKKGLSARFSPEYLTEEQKKLVIIGKRDIKKTGSEFLLYDPNALRKLIQEEMLILWVRDDVYRDVGNITLDDIREVDDFDYIFIEQKIERMLPGKLVYSANQIICIGEQIKEKVGSETGIRDAERMRLFCDNVDCYIRSHFCDISKNYNKHIQLMKISDLPPIWKRLGNDSIESESLTPEELIDIEKQLVYTQGDEEIIRLEFSGDMQNAISISPMELETAKTMQDNELYLKERYSIKIPPVLIRKKDLESIRLKAWPVQKNLFVASDFDLYRYLVKIRPVVYRDIAKPRTNGQQLYHDFIQREILKDKEVLPTTDIFEWRLRNAISHIGSMRSYDGFDLQRESGKNRILLRVPAKGQSFTQGKNRFIEKAISDLYLDAGFKGYSIVGIVYNPVKLAAAIRQRITSAVLKHIDDEVTKEEELEIRFGSVSDEDWEY